MDDGCHNTITFGLEVKVKVEAEVITVVKTKKLDPISAFNSK